MTPAGHSRRAADRRAALSPQSRLLGVRRSTLLVLLQSALAAIPVPPARVVLHLLSEGYDLSAPRQPPATVPAALRRYRVEATPAAAYDALLAGGDR